MRKTIAKSNQAKLLAALLAVMMAALMLAPVAAAQPTTTAFPGSTSAIAFSSNRDGVGNYNVYRMNADGFGQTKLTDIPGFNFSPTWSADGKKIAFSAWDFDRPGEVYQMGADGSGQKNLTDAPSDDGSPSYSPTSDKVAFASNRIDNQFDIYLVTLGPDGQTTGLTRLTTNAARDEDPAISPDGGRIAFVSNRDGDDDIYVMKLAPEGPNNVPRKLTANTRPDPNGPPYMYDLEPDWSPDGKQIVFTSDRSGDMEIYRMKASPEGRRNRPVNLTKNSTAYDANPAWSPDGKKIAFSSDRSGNYDIWQMSVTNGAAPTNLTDNPASDFLPAWQPLP